VVVDVVVDGDGDSDDLRAVAVNDHVHACVCDPQRMPDMCVAGCNTSHPAHRRAPRILVYDAH